MKIADKKTIQEIQIEFNSIFPGLKIEFYKEDHNRNEPSAAGDRIDENATIGAIRTLHTEGDFVLHPDLTVAEVEQTLKRKYGLFVQIFRRSKELWLQTSTTDDWTLDKQNSKGLHSIGEYDQD